MNIVTNTLYVKGNNKLFEEFPPISTEAWEALIMNDLKGEDYDRKLIWHTPEGINVRPYYREENLPKTDLSSLKQPDYPFTREKAFEQNDWEIREDIYVKTPSEANKEAIYALMKGATSIYFDITRIEQEIKKDNQLFTSLLNDIYFDSISLNFKVKYQASHIIKLLDKEIKYKKLDPLRIDGSLNLDIFHELNTTGNFYDSLNKDIDQVKELIISGKKNIPGLRIIGLNGGLYKDCGANIVQEIAYTLAAANEFLILLTDRGLDVQDILPRIQFNLGVSTNYFFEIAKFRAFRYLWSKIQKAYLKSDKNISNAYIHATTSDINKTIYDPYVNILRTTAEAMAATLGGVDSLSIRPFNSNYQDSTRFSERIARNIQIILKREAYFGKVNDPGRGSYYIENLTESIIREAWRIFQTIDQKGGYISTFMEGYIQKEIDANRICEKTWLNQGRSTLLGTNKYPKPEEKASISSIKPASKPLKQEKKKLRLGKPLQTERLSEEFEIMRMRTEKADKIPVVSLFNYGDNAKSKARAIFSTNFMGCAGFKIIDNPQFKAIDEGIKTVSKIKPDIIVLCSSDEEYRNFAPIVADSFKGKTLIVIAGYPKEAIPELEKKGIRHFIHIKSNILETLMAIQDELGIK
ncbi:MAG: methylmalonyl-CoA mutase small subunit [Bacteroidales bacterium]|nr:methylmalonyl-CoA mutase small subunit [Bacteroidales bacterium]